MSLATLAHLGLNHFTWGDIHPVINHFPIVFFMTALVWDILFRFRLVESQMTSHWMIIVGAILTIPTVLTGLAAESFHENSPFIEIHEYLGIATMSFGLIHALIRIYGLFTYKMPSPNICIVLSLITVLLIGITSEYGGAVTRGHGLLIYSA